MIEKIALPLDRLVRGQVVFPIAYCLFYPGFAREGNDGVQVVGHEQHQTAVPCEFLVIVRRGREDGGTDVGLTELVLAARDAVYCDEVEGAFRDP